MDTQNLDLDKWQNTSLKEASQYCEKICQFLPQNITFLKVYNHIFEKRKNKVALFQYDNSLFSLIPGGEFYVGFNENIFIPTKEQLESFQSTADAYEINEDIYTYVKQNTTPYRIGSFSPFLVGINTFELGWEEIPYDTLEIQELLERSPHSKRIESLGSYKVIRNKDNSISAYKYISLRHSNITNELKEQNLRFLSMDEWEYVCGGGVQTLFRWGNEYPFDNPKLNNKFFYNEKTKYTPHLTPNFFGVNIAQDTYKNEVLGDTEKKVRGGDGGTAGCAGLGAFFQWLPLATSYYRRSDDLYIEDFVGNYYMRRVIPLT